MSDKYKAFVREMKRRMFEHGITPCALAKMLGRNHSTVYYWLRMKTTINGEDMLEIMSILWEDEYEQRSKRAAG